MPKSILLPLLALAAGALASETAAPAATPAYYYAAAAAAAAAAVPQQRALIEAGSPLLWGSAKAVDGRTYFYHIVTRATRWDAPPGFVPMEQRTEVQKASFKAMQKAANNGALITMLAENGIAIDVLAEQAAARGQTDPVYHGITRPSRMEGEATNRAIQLALVAGAPVYFVHLSASEALERVAEARDAGHNVFAETCPQ